MFSTGFNSGEREGSRMMVRFFGTLSLPVLCQPARSIRTTPWAVATLQLISSRCICIGGFEGEHESGALARPGADGAEQVGVGVALIGGQAWPGAPLRPNSRTAVLLSQSGLVLEPDFDPRGLGKTGYVGRQRAGEVFLNASMTRSSCLGCCGRALMCEKDSAASRSEIPRSL